MAATRSSDLGFAVYTDSGQYQLTPVQDQVFGFIPAPKQATGGEVRISSDLFLYAGLGAGAGGLGCRHQDHRNFYAFMARGDGIVAILKIKDGMATPLAQGTVKQVMPGAVDTRLIAQCRGDTLSLDVEGGASISATDRDFSQGASGIFVIGEKLAGTSAVVRQLHSGAALKPGLATNSIRTPMRALPIQPTRPDAAHFAAPVCRHCDAPLHTKYCGQCGQKKAERLGRRAIGTEIWQNWRLFELAVLKAGWRVLRWPGRVAREYVLGARTRHLHPLKLLLLAIGTMLLVLGSSKLLDSQDAQLNRAMELVRAYSNWSFSLAIFAIAASSLLVFARRGGFILSNIWSSRSIATSS